MTKIARIEDGLVVEVATLPADVDLADAFHPELHWVVVHDDLGVEIGWRVDGQAFGPPQALNLAAARAEAWDRLRSARNARLAETDALVRRHADQSELIAAGLLASATLDAAEYQALLVYRQALRDLVNDGEPEAAVWPARPAFIQPAP